MDLGIEGTQAVEVSGVPEGPLHHGPHASDDVDAEAHGGDRHDDVAVEDRRVDAVAPDRLQGDLGRQVGVADGVEDAAGPPDGPILGQRAPGLTHEPHGHVAGRQVAAGHEEGGVSRRGHYFPL
jgi:hypothetical protein